MTLGGLVVAGSARWSGRTPLSTWENCLQRLRPQPGRRSAQQIPCRWCVTRRYASRGQPVILPTCDHRVVFAEPDLQPGVRGEGRIFAPIGPGAYLILDRGFHPRWAITLTPALARFSLARAQLPSGRTTWMRTAERLTGPLLETHCFTPSGVLFRCPWWAVRWWPSPSLPSPLVRVFLPEFARSPW